MTIENIIAETEIDEHRTVFILASHYPALPDVGKWSIWKVSDTDGIKRPSNANELDELGLFESLFDRNLELELVNN